MSWSTWGLDPLADDASEAAMLTKGCRVFTLAVAADVIVDVDRLSERWSIWSMEISATAVKRTPRRGDVVVWRAFFAGDPVNWYLPGGPTCVVAMTSAGHPDVRQVLCLRDAQLDRYAPSVDEWPYRMKVSDRMLPRSREWDLLGTWRLHPPCPFCGGTSRAIIYGMPATDMSDRHDLVLAGCLLPENRPDYECSACGLEFALPSARRAAA